MFPGALAKRKSFVASLIDWSTTNLSIMLDVASVNHVVITNGKITTLGDASGNPNKFLSNGDYYAPFATTMFGRLFADYRNKPYQFGFAGSPDVAADFRDLYGPCTYTCVYVPPTGAPDGDSPIWSTSEYRTDANNLTLIQWPSGDIYVVRQDAGACYDMLATKPAGFTWDPNATYVISLVMLANGMAQVRVNGTNWTVSSLEYSVPAVPGAIASGSFELGYQNHTYGTNSCQGAVGMVAKYSTILTANELDALNTVRQSRYPSSG